MKTDFKPTKNQLEQLKVIDFELPENIDNVIWILEHAGDPITISLKWIPIEDFDEYEKNNRFLGMSVNETIPAFRSQKFEVIE